MKHDFSLWFFSIRKTEISPTNTWDVHMKKLWKLTINNWGSYNQKFALVHQELAWDIMTSPAACVFLMYILRICKNCYSLCFFIGMGYVCFLVYLRIGCTAILCIFFGYVKINHGIWRFPKYGHLGDPPHIIKIWSCKKLVKQWSGAQICSNTHLKGCHRIWNAERNVFSSSYFTLLNLYAEYCYSRVSPVFQTEPERFYIPLWTLKCWNSRRVIYTKQHQSSVLVNGSVAKTGRVLLPLFRSSQ